MVNTAQQVGGSIGTALLSTVAASAATAFASGLAGPARCSPRRRSTRYTTAFWWSAGVFALGAVLSFALLRPGTRTSHERVGEPAMAH